MKFKIKIFLLGVLIALSFIQSKSKKSFVDSFEGINYDEHIKPIIRANCLRCHAGKRPKAKLDLSVYANLVDAIKNKNLLKRINDPKKPMPKGGLMSIEERNKITKWVENNFQKTP